MRLIDADDFFARMENDTDLCAEMETAGLKSLKKYLNMQSTAYDIDKVIEELEEKASRYTKKYVTPYGNNGYRDVKAISVNKAIEIVKQDGVSDDFCEWNGERSRLVTFTRFTTNCGDNIDLQANSELLKAFRYCPFCGKKIKIVGD